MALRLPDGGELPGRSLVLAVGDDDRAAVVGDVLRRAAAWQRTAVRVARAGRDRLDLNVPPPDLAGVARADVAVGGVEVPAPHRVDVPPLARPDGDPLAVRLLVLGTPLEAAVDPAGLPAAADELARWRRRVGTWARSPSAPAPRAVVDGVVSAVADGLDTPRALTVLRDLEADETVPPGARMEAFLTLDRLLGLDLALGLVPR